LDPYQVVILCNVAAIPDSLLPKLQNYLRQGGGLLIFGGDRMQIENYNLKLVQSSPPLLPAELKDRRLGPESGGEKIDRFELAHPALKSFSDPILLDSIKSARVWGYSRTAAPGKTALITLGNGDPLLIEQKLGAGKLIFLATSADRDWSDLPVKTAYLPLIQSLTSYLAGGKRGTMDPGIAVGEPKEFSLPPGYVGKTLKIIKPDKREAEVLLAPGKDQAVARFQDNDRAGIYRLSVGITKESGTPSLYAVNSPFLESRLEEISEGELQAKLKPIRVQVISMDTLQQGGKRTDLALPLVGLLIITLLTEGWLAQRL
jgi:hypothetical protein